MPGPPSHLHHPALLFSWVAGLITDPRWHAIARTHAHSSSSHSLYPSLTLASFFFLHFFLSHCHTLSSFLSPAPNFFLSLCFLFSPLFSVTLSDSLLLQPAHSTSPFLFLCHPFFYFLCSFLFLTLLSPLSLSPLSLTLCPVQLQFSHTFSLSLSLSSSPQPSASPLTKSQGTRGGERGKEK